MGRVGDDAREPAGVEQAFLEVELPAAHLLRHQPALQPVGQTRHHALQVRELPVELQTQARQFLGIAQVRRVFHLVELVGEDLVARFALVPVVAGPRARLLAVGAGLQRCFELRFRRRLIVRVCFGIRIGCAGGGFAAAVLRVGGFLVLFLALLLLRLGLGVLRLIAGFLFVLLAAAFVFLQRQRFDQAAQHVGTLFLVVRGLGKVVEVGIELRAELAAENLAHVRRRGAEIHMAHAVVNHDLQRIGHLDLEERAGHLVALERQTLFQRFADILAHAGVLFRADRLDPGLFHGVVGVDGFLAGGHAPRVQGDVVMLQPQRHGIGRTAQAHHVLLAQLLRRHRQAHFGADCAKLLVGRDRREDDRRVLVAGDRSDRGRGRALEGLGFGRALLGIALVGVLHATASISVPGISSPKQR